MHGNWTNRRLRHAVAGATAAGVLVAAALGLTPGTAFAAVPRPAPPEAARPLRVTLGFDDGTKDQLYAAKLLRSVGMRGVFYINSGRLGTNAEYMTTGQVQQLQRDGHEIAGHSVYHLHLTQQDVAEQRRQICVDHQRLLGMGLRVSTFAYPFGEYTATTERVVRSCGYESARTISYDSDSPAEAIPPRDPLGMRAVSGLTPKTTAADLRALVARAQRSGGWLQLVFHHVCSSGSCASSAVRQGELTEFIRWLAAQRRGGALATATVQEVLHGKVSLSDHAPAVTATALTIQNRSLELPNARPAYPPRCFSYGTSGGGNLVQWSAVPDAHSGRSAQRAIVTSVGESVSLLTTQDLGSCAPPVQRGRSYRVGVWYKSTQPIQLVAYARKGWGSYDNVGASEPFPASSTWRLATWSTHTMSRDTAISIGASIRRPGTYTFDDFSLTVNAQTAHAVDPVGTAAGTPGDRIDEDPTPVAPAGSVVAGPVVVPVVAGPPAPGAVMPGGAAVPGGAVMPGGAAVPGSVAQPRGRQKQSAANGRPGHAAAKPRKRTHPGHRRPFQVLKPLGDTMPFLPPDDHPAIPDLGRGQSGYTRNAYPWLVAFEVGLALALAFGIVAILDRRLWHIHRGTQRPPAAGPR